MDNKSKSLEKDSKKLNLQGCMSFKKKNWEEAIKLFSQAIECNEFGPKFLAKFYYNRMNTYSQMNKYELVVKDAEKCVEIDPTWFSYTFSLGDALVHCKKYKEALAAFQYGKEKNGNKNEKNNASFDRRIAETKDLMISNQDLMISNQAIAALHQDPIILGYIKEDPDKFLKKLQNVEEALGQIQQDPRLMEALNILGKHMKQVDLSEDQTYIKKLDDQHVKITKENSGKVFGKSNITKAAGFTLEKSKVMYNGVEVVGADDYWKGSYAEDGDYEGWETNSIELTKNNRVMVKGRRVEVGADRPGMSYKGNDEIQVGKYDPETKEFVKTL